MTESTVDPKQQYYYHTLRTIFLVLEGGFIRSRGIWCLNDSDEISLGLRILQNALKEDKLKTILPGDAITDLADKVKGLSRRKARGEVLAYPLCFTSNDPSKEKSLTHWYMYSHEDGAALELDFSGIPNKSLGPYWTKLRKGETRAPGSSERSYLEGERALRLSSQSPYPRALTYLNPEDALAPLDKPKVAERIQLLNDMDPLTWATEIKRTAFEAEQESRLIFRPQDLKIDDDTALLAEDVWRRAQSFVYMDASSHISPYVDVYYSPSNDSKEYRTWEDFEKQGWGWPVRSVTLGPGSHQDHLYADLRTFLDGGTLRIQPLSTESRKSLALKAIETWLKGPLWKGGIITPEFREKLKKLDQWCRNCNDLMSPEMFSARFATEQNDLFYADEDAATACLNTACIVRQHGLLLRRTNLPFVF